MTPTSIPHIFIDENGQEVISSPAPDYRGLEVGLVLGLWATYWIALALSLGRLFIH